ncbi:MAG: hypothetical protein KGL39_17105 [Patescibacteria group bacterium]|nr:hypothetical protein [Patescibacteria group bacterium]
MGASENGLILGAQKYLTIADESSWATKVASPTYFHLPVTDYNCKFQPVNRQADPFIGVYERMHSQNYKGMVQGSLVTPLYGFHLPSMGMSIAQYLLDWCFGDVESTALSSKFVEWAEGPNVANKKHLGLRVNSATLSGSDDTGNISLSIDLMGWGEIGEDGGVDIAGTSIASSWTAQTLPTNRYKLVDYEYCGTAANADTTFSLNSSTIYPKSFTLQIQNALKPEYLNSFNPSIMPRSQRVITLSVVIPKQSDTWDAYSRLPSMTEMDFSATLKGLHQGTGTGGTNWTQVALDASRCSFLKSSTQGGKGDLSMGQLDFVILKPQSSTADLTRAYSDVA